jgi:hypothetical protein
LEVKITKDDAEEEEEDNAGPKVMHVPKIT